MKRYTELYKPTVRKQPDLKRGGSFEQTLQPRGHACGQIQHELLPGKYKVQPQELSLGRWGALMEEPAAEEGTRRTAQALQAVAWRDGRRAWTPGTPATCARCTPAPRPGRTRGKDSVCHLRSECSAAVFMEAAYTDGDGRCQINPGASTVGRLRGEKQQMVGARDSTSELGGPDAEGARSGSRAAMACGIPRKARGGDGGGGGGWG